MPPERCLPRLCRLSSNKAHIHIFHGTFFGTTDESIRRILEPEKRLERRTLQIHSDNLKTHTSSRATDVV